MKIVGILPQSCSSLAVRAAGAGRVGDAELVGIQEQSVGVVDLQDLFLPVQSVLLLCEGVDEAVSEGASQGAVLSFGRLRLVSVNILVFSNLSIVFVLLKG